MQVRVNFTPQPLHPWGKNTWYELNEMGKIMFVIIIT
jgi:hypothetical protein